nr:MAG TPA: hypothetical protein [Caudoviricetes sp.]
MIYKQFLLPSAPLFYEKNSLYSRGTDPKK